MLSVAAPALAYIAGAAAAESADLAAVVSVFAFSPDEHAATALSARTTGSVPRGSRTMLRMVRSSRWWCPQRNVVVRRAADLNVTGLSIPAQAGLAALQRGSYIAALTLTRHASGEPG